MQNIIFYELLKLIPIGSDLSSNALLTPDPGWSETCTFERWGSVRWDPSLLHHLKAWYRLQAEDQAESEDKDQAESEDKARAMSLTEILRRTQKKLQTILTQRALRYESMQKIDRVHDDQMKTPISKDCEMEAVVHKQMQRLSKAADAKEKTKAVTEYQLARSFSDYCNTLSKEQDPSTLAALLNILSRSTPVSSVNILTNYLRDVVFKSNREKQVKAMQKRVSLLIAYHLLMAVLGDKKAVHELFSSFLDEDLNQNPDNCVTIDNKQYTYLFSLSLLKPNIKDNVFSYLSDPEVDLLGPLRKYVTSEDSTSAEDLLQFDVFYLPLLKSLFCSFIDKFADDSSFKEKLLTLITNLLKPEHSANHVFNNVFRLVAESVEPDKTADSGAKLLPLIESFMQVYGESISELMQLFAEKSSFTTLRATHRILSILSIRVQEIFKSYSRKRSEKIFSVRPPIRTGQTVWSGASNEEKMAIYLQDTKEYEQAAKETEFFLELMHDSPQLPKEQLAETSSKLLELQNKFISLGISMSEYGDIIDHNYESHEELPCDDHDAMARLYKALFSPFYQGLSAGLKQLESSASHEQALTRTTFFGTPPSCPGGDTSLEQHTVKKEEPKLETTKTTPANSG